MIVDKWNDQLDRTQWRTQTHGSARGVKGIDLNPGPRLTGDARQMRVSFASGADRTEAVRQAVALLRREGVVVLDDFVDPGLLERCGREIEERFPGWDQPDRERHIGSYPGRHTASLVIDGALADPAIFASPVLREIDQAILGPDNVLESFGLLVSIPGAPDQGRHFDGLLFKENNLDPLLPAVALSIAIPLVRLDEVSGSTAFWRRSHRQPYPGGPPDFAPLLPVGSALVWDFRLIHSGRANLGPTPRPVLFAVHSRDWWMEPKREWASRYRKLQIAKNMHESFDKPMRDFTVRAELVDGDELRPVMLRRRPGAGRLRPYKSP